MTTEQNDKSSGGNWSVTVTHEPSPVSKQPDRPASGKWSVKVKQTPADKHETPFKHVDKSSAGGKSIVIKCDPPIPQEPAAAPEQAPDKPASGGSWSVSIQHEPAAKHKAPVKLHRSDTTAPKRNGDEPGDPAPGKSHSFVPMALCAMILVIGVACVFITRQRAAKQADEAQRTAQAYAAVTGAIARVEDLKKQVPPSQRQLDAPIADLQPIIRAASFNQDFPQRLDSAIQTVKAVEKKVLDAETGEEQAQLALETLRQHAEYKSLSGKLTATITEYKGLQKDVETKCQTLRSLIMAADQRITQLGGSSKQKRKN